MNPLIAVLIFALSMASLFDGMLTMLGIAAVIRGENVLDYSISAVAALLILGLGLTTKQIFRRELPLARVLIALWFCAMFFDIWTTLMGNFSYFALKQSIGKVSIVSFGRVLELTRDDTGLALTIFVLTGFVTVSPIVLSHLFASRDTVLQNQ